MKYSICIFGLLCVLTRESALAVILDNALTEDENEPSEEKESGLLSCRCGKLNKTMNRTIDPALADEIVQHGILRCLNSSFQLRDASDIMHIFKNCISCKVTHTKCSDETEDFYKFHCIKRSAVFVDPDFDKRQSLAVLSNSFINAVPSNDSKTMRMIKKRMIKYPKIFDTPIGSPMSKRHLRKRDVNCPIPNSLQTAEIKCRIFPSTAKCTQTCAIGFTLPHGREVVRTCTKGAEIWKPSNFQECMPYVDCGVTLISGGSKTCSIASATEGIHCTIKCLRYEDKDPVSERMYACDQNGHWTPNLPFCVTSGSGLELVEKPHKTKKSR